ncbi:hypothetical protein B0H17DRAFT_1206191 [Mycena rosella]|uniref:Uncharacterized protein n=1 Tax=Mycena rosella TaxID=1033263 RepID=A0AAD7D730_MYCRO|nr:hypothetical protein B0H17DRAFT_1206191 [Mycena rosella]
MPSLAYHLEDHFSIGHHLDLGNPPLPSPRTSHPLTIHPSTDEWQSPFPEGSESPPLNPELTPHHSSSAGSALTTPELWSRLEIAGAAGSVYTAPWLARAGNQPLTLSIIPDDPGPAETTQILAMLKEYAHRWRDVHLDLSFAEFHLFGPELHLQRLLISPRHNADADAPKHSIDAFRNAPALRELSLSMETDLSPAGIALPWAQLTTFTGSRMTFVECLDFLRCMPNLVNCRVDFEAPEDDPVPPVARLPPFPLLTSLYISSYHYARGGTEILDHISAPALETLELAASVEHVLYLEVLHEKDSEREIVESKYSLILWAGGTLGRSTLNHGSNGKERKVGKMYSVYV